ncbi:MAG: hypothetical protein HQK60_12920 [Deltaproteobacteria bacterium]|nr:hypothetical protein [Deltaproteobacteria bacterium]
MPHLKELAWKRIEKHLVAEKALEELICLSGGLLRDLVKYMQDACKEAIRNNSLMIDQTVVRKVKAKHVNDYYRLFDFQKYGDAVRVLQDSGARPSDELLTPLLTNLFILEYRWGEGLWFDAHPCLKEVLQRWNQR